MKSGAPTRWTVTTGFFTVDNETELKIYSRVNLVIDANGTPDDFTDDRVIDALFCNDCTED